MKIWTRALFCLVSCLMIISSCGDKDSTDGYNPSLPVELLNFYPESGGIATKMILEGANFGADTANIQVYFNEKRAALIGLNGEKMYVLVPRLPGDTCTIKVKVGDQEKIYTNKFYYKKQFVVTTIVGQPDTEKFQEGTLATATFGEINNVAVDKDKNIFVTQSQSGDYICALVNELDNKVSLLVNGSDNLHAPAIDKRGVVYVPEDGGDKFYELDPANLWVSKTRLILHPSLQQQSQGWVDFKVDWKQSFAFCEYDNFIYTRSYGGQLVKFDPVSRVGQLVDDQTQSGTNSYLVFSPVEPHILFISYVGRHAIYSYNIKTKEHKLYAGKPGIKGWKDGEIKDAEFYNPRQMALGKDGSLYVADAGNNCIRQISPDGVVSTVVGIPGEEGYVDGGPDVAKFKNPRGIAIDDDGTFYITDSGNRCLRKLTIE